MSADEQCQVKCCERHLMCFISVCLNCPGTLESLSVNQIRRNETRLLSSGDTCLSAVTQANGGKKRGFFSRLLKRAGYMIARLAPRWGKLLMQDYFIAKSPRERTEVTLWSSFKHLEFRNINYQMRRQSGRGDT